MGKLVSHSEDDLVFLNETVRMSGHSKLSANSNVWQVMIIDDDADVHTATTFALSNVEIQNRPLAFLHAYSAQQAREILSKEAHIAVILLDLAMGQRLSLIHI